MPPSLNKSAQKRGFSLLELLVTAAIAAGVIAVAALAYGAIVRAQQSRSAQQVVDLGTTVSLSLFGTEIPKVLTFSAPNHARNALAEELREALLEDLTHSNAVFILARPANTTFRTAQITIPTGTDVSRVDTPEAFRSLLATTDPSSATIFSSYRGASPSTNFSMFILQPSPSADLLTIRAIYEMDLVPTTSPSGTYACVRRFVGSSLAGFYDIFYPPDNASADFLPVLCAFERRARLALDEGNPIDAFKRAKSRPFYFVWWPDPSMKTLRDIPYSTSYLESDPRFYYKSMADRSSLFLVIPMFPSL